MRKNWMAAISLSILTLVGVTALADDQLGPPNIVLIISDDQAWNDYSFMDHPQISTPNIDQLARESLTFTRGYVPCSLCCPSLASLITGLYPHQHRITSNDPPIPDGMKPGDFQTSSAFAQGRETMVRQLESVPTLPRMLQPLGYVSFQSGKWWQGNYRHGGFTDGMTKGQRHGDQGLAIGRSTMQPIFDFVHRAKDQGKPFLVWYAPMMPHEPHTPPEPLLKKYQAVAPSLEVARYWAMVEWFDQTVGDLLQFLDDQELRSNTIVVYLADNGWIQNVDRRGYAAKSKQSPYDGGLRTPIIIRWPDRIQPSRSEDLAISIDIVPTLLAALEQPPTSAMQGINLLDPAATGARTTIFGECFTHNAIDLESPSANLRWRWVVNRNWKLIDPNPKLEPNQSVELYDLEVDPHEEHNVAADHADLVSKLRTQLDDWWQPAAVNE